MLEKQRYSSNLQQTFNMGSEGSQYNRRDKTLPNQTFTFKKM